MALKITVDLNHHTDHTVHVDLYHGSSTVTHFSALNLMDLTGGINEVRCPCIRTNHYFRF